MPNSALIVIVLSAFFFACLCFVTLRPKSAAVLAMLGLMIFGYGVARDTMYPPPPIAVAVQ
jgi:hypothetical protein